MLVAPAQFLKNIGLKTLIDEPNTYLLGQTRGVRAMMTLIGTSVGITPGMDNGSSHIEKQLNRGQCQG